MSQSQWLQTNRVAIKQSRGIRAGTVAQCEVELVVDLQWLCLIHNALFSHGKRKSTDLVSVLTTNAYCIERNVEQFDLQQSM
jgi:hypothetical protein